MEEDVGGLRDADQVSDRASPDLAGIDALWRSLHRDIRRRGTDAHLADDVAQEAWLRLLRRPPRGSQFLKPWLRVVAMRVQAELMGKERSRLGRERRVAQPEATEETVGTEDTHVLRLAEELPSPYREVVRLRYVEDYEVEEIAHRFGITPGTVRSQLKRGLDRLRIRLESSETGEHDPKTRRSKRSLLAWLGIRGRGAEASSGFRWARWGLAGCFVLAAFLAWIWHAGREPTVVVAGLTDDHARAPVDAPLIGGISTENVRTQEVPAAPAAPPADPFPRRAAFGTVRLPDGSPVAGATVWKGDIDGEEKQIVATTDSSGRFALDSVEVSRFLWATHPGWLPSWRGHSGTSVAGVPTDLVLSSPSGRLDLLVREEDGRPVAGAEVELDWGFDHCATTLVGESGELRVDAESQAGMTDDRGRLELPRPAASEARIRVRMPGRASHVETRSLASDGSSLELVLPPAATLTGVVVNAPGEPARHARVELHTRAAAECSIVETDESGAFELALDPGPFELRAREDSGRGPLSCRVEGVLEGRERRALRLVLTEDGSLGGQAVVMGAPFADAFVTYSAPGLICPHTDLDVRTDADGRFLFSGLPPGKEVTLRLYSPSLELLCELGSVRVGTKDVLLSSETDPTGRSLVLEFDCDEPSLVPTLVECRVPATAKAQVFPVDASTRRCTVLAPQASSFHIFPWIPGLGTWKVEGAGFDSSDVQHVRVPRPARVTFQVDLPPGTTPEAVRAGIRQPGFGCSWVILQRGWQTYQEIRLDPASLSAEIRLLPGYHRYFFQAPGLAHAGGAMRLEGGETIREVVRLEEGIETDVKVLVDDSAIDGNDVPVLAFRTPKGWLELEGLPVKVGDSQVSFRVSLPRDTLELEAFGSDESYGSIPVQGALGSGMARPSFQIELDTHLPDGLADRHREVAMSRRRK